jgi:hypothetical protein
MLIVKIQVKVMGGKGCPQGLPVEDWSAAYQLVGRVMAYQGYDG